MDYNLLLDMVTKIGYRLAMCGAETFRVEESVNRIMAAYGIQAETFSIPNCLHVSVITEEGKPMTRMRRIGFHGNDLDSVEKYSNLSRRICKEVPDPSLAMEWIQETDDSRIAYSFPFYLLGNFLGASGFSILFGAGFPDCLIAGICGLIIGLVNHFMENQKANQFFRIITAAFLMAVFAYFIGFLQIAKNTDAVTIGALMILVPGLLFTNAMRDIIYGDTNSGINRIVQVILIAVAIALGTAAAWNLSSVLWGPPTASAVVQNPLWVEMIAAFLGCIGFFILFNIHGYGGYLCALGGVLSWFFFRATHSLLGSEIIAYFCATLIAALYSEIMARIRKYPAISYLVVASFPLIPGAGVYYAMTHAVRGETASLASRGLHTAAIAGIMAAGIILASTTVRMISQWRQKRLPHKYQ